MMKRTLFLLSAAVLLLASCGKEHQCKCTYDDYEPQENELNVFVVDGLNCEDITEMAYEHTVPAQGGGNTLERYDSRKVSCRDYGN